MKIIILGSAGRSTNILFNFIAKEFAIDKVIIEEDISRLKFLKARYKKVGLIRFLDQLFFMVIAARLLSFLSRKRQAEIIRDEGLSTERVRDEFTIHVSSVNAVETRELIVNMAPDIILVSGTRILSKKLINATAAQIINIHAGVTPDYRGVHGAYWALVNKQPKLAGVTVHYVDEGVDTGNIISQKAITVTEKDQFSTYPLLQLATGVRLVADLLRTQKEGKTHHPVVLESKASKQWYHPGFFEYLYHRLLHGVK